MTAADYQKSHHSPLRALPATVAALCDKDETSRYLALEPIPFRISDHLTKKHGSSSAVTTFTLRHPTWASDVQKALDAGPDAFVALMKDIDAQVAEIASKAKKLS